jgi:hypothetical protein
LTGTYSNGVNMDRYQIGLAIFRNQWGLEKKGDNLYSENRDSGLPTINTPGTGGAGTLSPNSLEQSNVDLAEEFVDMIVQQRGFQANSKVITTTDTMLAELINLKRYTAPASAGSTPRAPPRLLVNFLTLSPKTGQPGRTYPARKSTYHPARP